LLKRVWLVLILLVLCTHSYTLAHSGRTDSSGGHRDNKNASGLGSYHYHHGYPAHLHTNGICPYDPKDTITVKNMVTAIDVGESVVLDWLVTYYSGSSEVSWSSSDNDIVSVSKDGKLTAINPGKANITATMRNGSKTFSVSSKEVMASEIEFENVIDKLELNSNFQIKYNLLPHNTTNKNVSWSSNNPQIVSVDDKGKITANAIGEAIISAVASNGKKTSLSIETYEVFPEKIELSESEITMNLGESFDIVASVFPENTTNSEIEWTSSNLDVASVDNKGKVLGNGVGVATITVTCQNISNSINIEVVPIKAEKIVFNQQSIPSILNKYIKKGESFIPSVTIIPTNATYQDITFKSSDEGVMGFNDNILTAIDSGKVEIVASTVDTSTVLELAVVNYTFVALTGILIILSIFVGVVLYRKVRK